MKELECYMLGHIASGSDEIKLATPVRPHNMALSFTESLGQFFFEFAEKHFHCEAGDEVVLVSSVIDCSDISDEAFLARFKEKSQDALMANGEILKRRKTLSADSEEISLKVRSDLYQSHRLMMQA